MDRAALLKSLVDILERSVGEPVAAVNESMRLQDDLGLDSIDVVSMAIEVQSEFNIDLKTEELKQLVVVKDLLDLMQAKIAANQTRAA
jgi:acyl carrier protein